MRNQQKKESEYGKPMSKALDHPNEDYSHGVAGYPNEPCDYEIDF
jgi:hypothetical protein